MNCTVLGCGRWGSFLACFHSRRNRVVLWGRKGSRSFETLRENRKNDYLTLPDEVLLEERSGQGAGRQRDGDRLDLRPAAAGLCRPPQRLSHRGQDLYPLHERAGGGHAASA